MYKRVWKETRVFILVGASMPAVAYVAGADLDAVMWALAMFFAAMLFFVVDVAQRSKDKAGALNDISVSEDLGHEMDLLVQQIENSTTVMLGHVRDELSQIRSLVSDAIVNLQSGFNDINQGAGEQSRIMREILEELNSALGAGAHREVRQNVEDIESMVDRRINELSAIEQQICGMVSDVVRSLQFEDIVQQLTVSSEKHLDYIEAVLDAVDVGIRNLNSQKINVPEYIVGLHELKSQIDQLEAECKAEAERSVSQRSMHEGEVLLF